MPNDQKKRAKVQFPREYACSLLNEGHITETKHGLERMKERRVTSLEVEQIIKKGRHEPKEDRWVECFSSWTYSIVGTTIDDRELRVVIAFSHNFDHPWIVLITVIDPNS